MGFVCERARKEDFESLEKRLREKGIVICMMYRPLSDGGKKEVEYIFRKRSELLVTSET